MNMFKKCLFVVFALSLISCTQSKKTAQAEITWVSFDEQLLESNKELPVFINFTADYCYNCVYMENNFLKSEEFTNFISENGVLTMEITVGADNYKRVKKWFGENLNSNSVSTPTYVFINDGKVKAFDENSILNYIQ